MFQDCVRGIQLAQVLSTAKIGAHSASQEGNSKTGKPGECLPCCYQEGSDSCNIAQNIDWVEIDMGWIQKHVQKYCST